MYSRQTLGACVPTFGRAELDFEPLLEGEESFCEFARDPRPERMAEYERALVQGVLEGLASPTPETGCAGPVSARVVVRDLIWHWTDSCDQVFLELGALAAREALRCVTEDRAPQPIETKVRLFV
ncbi:hypothetical protein [Streptomyces sp. NPDC001678]|uniref:hypothetical protein n=1 Tax=Streptomyces sp. NPDC001678 TaxID=3364599 RepID=UPI0036CB9C3F